MVSAILPHGGVNGLKLCPWYYLSGYPCPFCGMTRGFVAITHFDLQSAMEFNPGSPFIYGAFAYMMWASISALRKGESEMKPLSKILYISWLVPTLAVFTLMFYQRIVRVLLL
ncbi:MAG: DUF2752 domain-containing protein [Candidatus Poseidoniales archaeon]